MIKIGRFTKPHGVKGELSLMSDYHLFDEGDEDDIFLFCDIDGILVPFYVESFRPKTSAITLVKLENVESEEKAAELSNLDVYFPEEALDLENEDLSWNYFIGFRLIDSLHGFLGTVADVDESTINTLLRIEKVNGDDLLLPAVPEFIHSIDSKKKELRVTLPDGLLDL